MKTQSQIHHTLNKLLSKNKVEATEQYEVIGNHDDTKQGSAQGPTTAA